MDTPYSREQHFEYIFNHACDAFIEVDDSSTIIEWNLQAANILGWSRQETVGRKFPEQVIAPEKRSDIAGLFQSGANASPRIETLALRRNEEIFPVELTITCIRHDSNIRYFIILQDISSRKAGEQRLLEMATVDILTGLANRSQFNNQLPEAMARARRNQTTLGLMYLDVDHFKSINDSMGHEAGDQILKEFSSLLRATLRETDLISRLGGDEFTVILENIGNSENAGQVASNIIDAIQHTVWLQGNSAHITSSIGIALYKGEDTDTKDLISMADKAMYKAKHAGRNTFKILPDDASSHHNVYAPEDKIRNARTMLTMQSDGERHFLQNTLQAVRKHLGMDIAFISHIHDGVREFKVVDFKDPNPPIAVGGSNPVEEGYCQRVIDGRLPEIMGDAFEFPEALGVPATKILPVRAHMSVPIKLSNGDIYGTFCCFSYTPDQSLNERDISVMHVFADLVSSHIEKSLEK